MKTFLLILAVILWVAIRANAAKVKRESRIDDASEPSQPGYDPVRSAFESLFDEDLEAESTRAYSAQEDTGADDYSYETMNEPEPEPTFDKPETEPIRNAYSKVAKAADEAVVSDFDLRQAVIYQTILSNKYLDEIHSTEN